LQLHEQKAFWKFFLTYFSSVAILILVAGHFYYKEQYQQLIKDEHFAIINYARQLKMHEPLTAQDIHHATEMKKIDNFSMNTITMTDTSIEKYIPANRWHTHYIHIIKDRHHFDAHVQELRIQIISIQIFLLLLFALLSLLLTNTALRPMKEAIAKLDRFTKDLIHDLNTPLTTIKLNIKLLSKKDEFKENKALQRIVKSSYEISELHDNLKVLLEEDTFLLEDVALCPLIHEQTESYKRIFPNLNFAITCSSFQAHVNKNAFKQLLHNLLSNACKYNRTDGSVSIYVKERTLYIQDSGSGIKNPERIFERNYSEQSSSGLGLDIVKRLCDAMNITIDVTSSTEGTTVALSFT
jgi:two-component system OmpR family sensor kinase